MVERASRLYGLVVRFKLAPGHEEAFDRLVAVTVAQIAALEPETLVYVTHRDASSPDTRVFYELYADEAAFAAHESAPHTRRFLAERAAHLAAAPEVWRVSPGAGVVRPGVALGDG